MTEKQLSHDAIRILKTIHEQGLIVRSVVHEEGYSETPHYGTDYHTGQPMPWADWLLIERELWRIEHRHGARETLPPTVTRTQKRVTQGTLVTESYLLDVPAGLKGDALAEGVKTHAFPETLAGYRHEPTDMADTILNDEISLENHISRFEWIERVSDYMNVEIIDQGEIYEAWNGRLSRYMLTDKALKAITPP